MVGDFTAVGLLTSHSFIDVFRENATYKTPTLEPQSQLYSLLLVNQVKIMKWP